MLAEIQNNLIQTASTENRSTGIILPEHKLIITTLHTINNNKEILICGKRFPKTLAKVIFADPLYNIAFIEAPEGVLFPELKYADTKHIKSGDSIFAVSYLFGEEILISERSIEKTDKTIINNNLTISNISTSKENILFNKKGELIGINNIIFEQNKKQSIIVNIEYILKSIDEYQNKNAKYALKCPSCKIISDISELNNYQCPHCKKPLNQILIAGKKEHLSPTAEKIETIIKKLNYEVAISRIGKNYWEIDEGSASIRISYDEESGYISSYAVLCQLPPKPSSNLEEYMLMENNYLKGLSFGIHDNNIILSMLKIHKKNLHIATAVKLFKYLFNKADDYDDILIEMGAIAFHENN